MAASPVSGVGFASGVRTTAGITAYLGVLRGKLDASIPIYVTSGERDAVEQASAMLKKLAAGGEKELYDVYAADSVITRLLAAPRNAASWAAIIVQEAAAGRPLSRHLRAGAFDLRTSNLTAAQIQNLKIAIEATGGKYILEGAPPHLHVDLPAKYAILSGAQVAGTVAAKGMGLALVGSALLGVVVLVVLVARKKRAPALAGPAPAAPVTPTPNPRRRRRRRAA